MTVLDTHRVRVEGPAWGRPIVFAHGLGCDQLVWRHVAPAFRNDHRVVVFDHVGHGGSTRPFDPERHRSLEGYAEDVLEICAELDLRDAVFVGHSVSAMIGALAAIRQPQRISELVLVAPSARYIDDAGYTGGFSREQIDELLADIDADWEQWAEAMGPVIMGNDQRPQLGAELTYRFCRTDHDVVKQFARATFLSDSRPELPKVDVPTLILQCSEDAIAPRSVGEYVHRQIAGSELVMLTASGHCPHMSAPAETVGAIRQFLGRRPAARPLLAA